MTSDEMSRELARLNHELIAGTQAQRAAAADRLAQIKSEVPIDFRFFVSDKLWGRIGPILGDIMEASGSDPRNNVPTATLKLKGTSEYIETFMSCRNTMIGVEVEVGGLTFAFYVKRHGYKFEKAAFTSTVELRGIWDILNYYQIWPVWWMPLIFQPFSHAIFIGPLVTVIENMISECALRIQSGLWEFVNNITSLNPDVRAWFGTLLQSNGNIFTMLKTPTYVVRTNPFFDSSPLYARTVRMESCGKVIGDITRPYGVEVRVDLWRPGMPQPDQWANLTQPTYVVRVVDRSQVEGPTKTILDSVLRTVVDYTGAVGLTSLLAPLFGSQSPWAPEGVYVAPRLGLNYVRPLVVVVLPRPGEENPKTPVITAEIFDHTPMGWQHIIGGKSPRWLNSLINAFLSWIIDSIMILVGISGIPGDLLAGFLNDSIMAFQMIELYGRRSDVGPYHPGIEVFTPTNSAPYNIEALFAFINAIWDSRGFTSAQVVIRHGSWVALGRDVARGGVMALIYSSPTGPQRIFTDYIENTVWKISPTERDLFFQIGDGKSEEAPLARQQRLITGLQEALNVVTITPSQ